jgi:hypothetical protein
VRGAWSGTTYINESIKLQIDFPDGWKVAKDDYLAELAGMITAALTDKEKWTAEAATKPIMYDMMAVETASKNSILLVFDNFSMMDNGSSITEEDLYNSQKAQMEEDKTLAYKFYEPSQTTIGGVTYSVWRADEMNNHYSRYDIIHKNGKFMTRIIITLNDDTKIDTILAMFK